MAQLPDLQGWLPQLPLPVVSEKALVMLLASPVVVPVVVAPLRGQSLLHRQQWPDHSERRAQPGDLSVAEAADQGYPRAGNSR